MPAPLEPPWITAADAAVILGVTANTVEQFRARGLLGKRPDARHRQPSFSKPEILAFHQERQRRDRAKKSAKQTRDTAEAARRYVPDEREWLTPPETAKIIGITTEALHARIKRGKIPAARRRGRYWILASEAEYQRLRQLAGVV